MFIFGDTTRDNKGAVFNLVLSVLVIVFGSYYIREVRLIKELDHSNFIIAFILLLGLVAEPYALFIKINSVYAGEHAKRNLTGRYIFLWLTHILVTVMTLMVMAFAMPRPLKIINLPLFVVIGVKEFVFLFYLLNRQVTDEPKRNGDPWPQPKKFSDKKIFWADVILSVYAFLVFGITWQSVGASGFMQGITNEMADSYVFRIFTFTFMFFIIYFPIRLVHFIEEWLHEQTPQQKRNYRISLGITMLSCIGPLFTGGPVPSAEHINERNGAGKTPLITAIEYEPLPYIRRLIEAGADINAQDTTGRAALHYAAKGGRVEAIELLLQSGADPNVQRKSGGTALALVAGYHHTEAMEILLKYRADPNIAYYDGETPLMEAAHQGYDPEAVDLLLKNKANASQQDTAGWCAIAYFSHVNNTGTAGGQKILDLLVKNTNLKLRDNKGHTLVWHAMRYNGYGYTDIARILLKAGAAWDSTDIIKDGWNEVEEKFIKQDTDTISQ